MDERRVIKVRNGQISKKDREVLDPVLKAMRDEVNFDDPDAAEKDVNHAIRTMQRGEIIIKSNGTIVVPERPFTEEEREQVLKALRPLRKMLRPVEKMCRGITVKTIEFVLDCIEDDRDHEHHWCDGIGEG